MAAISANIKCTKQAIQLRSKSNTVRLFTGFADNSVFPADGSRRNTGRRSRWRRLRFDTFSCCRGRGLVRSVSADVVQRQRDPLSRRHPDAPSTDGVQRRRVERNVVDDVACISSQRDRCTRRAPCLVVRHY